jgi:hypothetical protein
MRRKPTELKMGEMDRLLTMLFPKSGQELLDIKFFPGEQPVTVEEFCEEVHAAFLQVESGQTEAMREFPEELRPVHVDRFLADT